MFLGLLQNILKCILKLENKKKQQLFLRMFFESSPFPLKQSPKYGSYIFTVLNPTFKSKQVIFDIKS